MKHLLIDDYVRIIEKCIPKIMKGMRFIIPRQAMGIKLSFSQGLALVCLGDHDFCKMTELSKETDINLTALTGVIDGLVKDKLVIRKRIPEDRRVVMISLTSFGRKLVSKVRQYRKKGIKRVVESLDAKRRDAIIRGFEKMVSIFYEQSTKNR